MPILHFHLLKQEQRKKLINEIQDLVLPDAPFFTPTMKSGTPFNYEMTNCGEFGWISDRYGYRYTKEHPTTSQAWPALTPNLQKLIEFLKRHEILEQNFKAQTCLINKYEKKGKLGLHQDNTEENLTAPIISISLGVPGIFLLGGFKRTGSLQEILLEPGDIFILSGEDRLRYHGFKGILGDGKRINLTIRQVN
ncbi:MAG: Alpha-ketoglutarate-dependent dioxygenase AlkB (plasmid) [Chroococcopsis gigantea SAG 12.99]|nr:Alpha-ketoglutarate-dependent dioxygenase AlkB [Chroococcopsis gigantea SAG 12.99]